MTPAEHNQVADLRRDAAEADAARLRVELANQTRLTAQYRDACERLVADNDALRDEVGRLRAEGAEAFAAFTYGRGTEPYLVVMQQWGEHVREEALKREDAPPNAEEGRNDG